jgi:glycosyltransferase involved in cell wall biosynthesis
LKISTIMPTRNRPENLKRIFQSAIETVSDLSNYEFSLRLDTDDKASMPVIEEFQAKGLQVRWVIGEREYCHGRYWNDAWRNATGEIYQMSGDDFIYRTKGWDEQIRKEFLKYEDRILFVFGNDLIHYSGGLGTHAFIHRNWTDVTKYFVQERTVVFYHDTWNHVLADKINRIVFRDDLIFEHLHPITQRVQADNVMLEMLKKGEGPDVKIWDVSWPEMEWEANKLRKKIKYDSNDKYLLSVLVPTITERSDLLKRLNEKLIPQLTKNVEVLYCGDNKERSTGAKRNQLIDMARGKYIVFVDDDDLVCPNYIELILRAISSGCDVVGIHLLMTTGGDPETECRTYHSLRYSHWYDEPDPDRPGRTRYFRNPNHLNPVKRELAWKARFPDLYHGEDHEYSKALLPYLKTESYIEEPIYYYLCRG